MNDNKLLRSFLYVLFFFLIAASGVICFYIFTQDNTPPEIEVRKGDEVIEVPEKEKYEIKINADSVKMSPDVNFAEERAKYNNQDIIARLEIPDLLNLLVVKGSDNNYYLEHNIYRNSDVTGSTFMDYRVSPDSNQVNIYGHNSRDDSLQVPFRDLEKFLDKGYFDSHPYIILQYENGKNVYKITSLTEVYNNNLEHMKVNKSGQDFVNHMNAIKSNPVFSRSIETNENSKYIILQTCSHHLDNAVYLITGVKINYVTG